MNTETRVHEHNMAQFEEKYGTYRRAFNAGKSDAIKALAQQPCEDCISRQAVHDLIAEVLSDYLHDEDREKIEELDVKIEDLEPVTPKEKTDAGTCESCSYYCGLGICNLGHICLDGSEWCPKAE